MFAEFHNSDLYHIMAEDNKNTLCSIYVAAGNEFIKEYAETNYPMPRLVSTPSRNRKLCKKCSEKNNQ